MSIFLIKQSYNKYSPTSRQDNMNGYLIETCASEQEAIDWITENTFPPESKALGRGHDKGAFIGFSIEEKDDTGKLTLLHTRNWDTQDKWPPKPPTPKPQLSIQGTPVQL